MSKIYHYTKLSTAIEYILPNMTLKTNYLNNMNDPKENQLWAFGGINIDYASLYPENYDDKEMITYQFRLGEDIKKSIQALCFVDGTNSKGYFNEMMWAHYAENHRGVCLEIDKEIFTGENENISFLCFENIKYQQLRERPSLFWRRNESPKENIERLIEIHHKTLFMTKSQFWEKENETRLLVKTDKEVFLNIKNSLTGIYCRLSYNYNYLPVFKELIDAETTILHYLYYENNRIKSWEIKDYFL